MPTRASSTWRSRILAAALLLLGASTAWVVAAGQAPTAVTSDAGRVRFNRDIRPIMAGTCFRCHGPDESSRMAGMRLDLRDEAIRARRNGTPIVPGNPDASLIVQRIFADAPARRMPPASIHKDLTPAQKDIIRRWIAEGAEYEGHWAYQPPQRPAVRALTAPERNAVDVFVLSRLRAEGLQPSPEADRRTLIRRVSLDLTGLAPSKAEVDAFLADRSPRAYERVVDRLLASPRFAEKQALYWLDAVRYADTSGFHGDNPYPAWPYRDYVLDAFRTNKPFDQFTREQLAGDLLPAPSVEQRIASAFNRMNRVSGEGGIQEKEYLAKYGADRVRTVSSVWMGTTVGCAECHDHKFDPILAKDFYALKAFFADIDEPGLARDGGGRNGPEAWGVKLQLPTTAEKQQLEKLDAAIAAARGKLAAATTQRAPEQRSWTADLMNRFNRGELRWQFTRPEAATARGATLTIHDDMGVRIGSLLRFLQKPVQGLIVASGANPDTDVYTVTLKPGRGVWRSLGLEIARDDSLPGGYVARGGLGVELSEVEASVSEGGGAPRQVKFSTGVASGSRNAPGASVDETVVAAIDGDVKTSWLVGDFGTSASNPFVALQFAEPVTTTESSSLVVVFRHESTTRRATLGRFRLALSAGPAWPDDAARGGTVEDVAVNPDSEYRGLPESLVRAITAPAQMPPAPDTARRPGGRQQRGTPVDESDLVETFFQLTVPELAPLRAEIARLEAAKARLEMGITRVMVSQALATPRETRILPRGNWMDDSGAVVEPAIPEFLGVLPTGGRRATRLDLANWLVSRDNPLTARVFVNRVWRQFFGTGLSSTLGDLGSQGEWPSHPDLLDWLAAEFMEPSVDRQPGSHQWDIKHLMRTIVTSHTYRQSSMPVPEAESKDPNNRLLARQNRLRVEAEVVRDLALQASGLLVEKLGGPSVRPYQPEGYLAALNYPRRAYSESHDADLYRRGLYTFWQRTFLHPSMLAFDAPSREEAVLDRITSNTPLQALDLLNDPIFVEAARAFAALALRQPGSTDARIRWAFERALNREPDGGELGTLASLHASSLRRFQANPSDAEKFVGIGESAVPRGARVPELAAMASVTRAVLSLHEMITRN
jgi:hypothetical protein